MNPTKRKLVTELSPQDLLAQINNICILGSDTPSTEDLLENSLRGILELFNAQRGSIFLLNAGGKELVLKTALGMKVDEQKRMVKRLGEGIVGKVAELKEPLLVGDIAADKRFKNYQSRRSYNSPSFICSPLLIKDKLIGVINIADKQSGKPFGREELQLLDFLSSQVALNYQRTTITQKLTTILQESEHLKDQLGKSSQEASYLKKQIQMQERLASLGKLAGGIAHEFNNPLDGVIRYTTLCLDHAQNDEVLREYLLEIKEGLKRMANIVKNLLACARNSTPTMRKVDINKTIEQALKELHPYLA